VLTVTALSNALCAGGLHLGVEIEGLAVRRALLHGVVVSAVMRNEHVWKIGIMTARSQEGEVPRVGGPLLLVGHARVASSWNVGCGHY
jgi:hypothetical protein